MYTLLLATTAGVLKDFGLNPKHLGAELGMTTVLHTHSRRLDFHPHCHVIVPGGGVALLAAQKALDGIKRDDSDEMIGVQIVRRSLEEPLRQIAQNAGAEGSIVVERVREKGTKNFGYNAATDKYEDLVKSGVIDPTKVTRTALQNAASIAGLLLTTEAVVVDQPEDTPMPAMPGGGDMGGMY